MADALGIKALSLLSPLVEGIFQVGDLFKGKDKEDHSWQKPSPTDRESTNIRRTDRFEP